jgi:hypothetical protein
MFDGRLAYRLCMGNSKTYSYQKFMAEFFIDLVSKFEEMTPELKTVGLRNLLESLDEVTVKDTLEGGRKVQEAPADSLLQHDAHLQHGDDAEGEGHALLVSTSPPHVAVC